MRRQKFVEKGLDSLLEDKDIQKYISSAPVEERERMEAELEQSVGIAYDKYASEYFETKGLGSYVSKFLRGVGGVTDVLGTYLFWAAGGAGLGLKFTGVGIKSAADLIDYAHYEKHQKGATLADRLKIGGEGLVERAAAYLPIGVGELADLLRGTSKYDRRVVIRARAYAKKAFLDKIGQEYEETDDPQIVPLANFKDPRYDQKLQNKLEDLAA
jgi:hypothetical protein